MQAKESILFLCEQIFLVLFLVLGDLLGCVEHCEALEAIHCHGVGATRNLEQCKPSYLVEMLQTANSRVEQSFSPWQAV